MMKLVMQALVAVCFLVVGGCAEGDPSSVYVGDGMLEYLERPGLLGSEGWKVLFDEFPLSKEYSASYFFQGLPQIEKLDCYSVYLYVPPTLTEEQLGGSVLRMSLHIDGELMSEFHAPMRRWVCTSYSSGSWEEVVGDGLEKGYYHASIAVPANPTTRYELRVEYLPSEGIGGEDKGRIYLRIGGSK